MRFSTEHYNYYMHPCCSVGQRFLTNKGAYFVVFSLPVCPVYSLCATAQGNEQKARGTDLQKVMLFHACILFCCAASGACMQSAMAQQSSMVAATPPAHSLQGPVAPEHFMHVCAVGSFRRPATEVQRHAPCLCWILIIRNPTVELAATLARGIITTEGLLQRARVVRIECDMVLLFVEMRRPSRISQLLDQLEGRSDAVAEPWLGSGSDAVRWLNQESARGFGGLRVILDLNRAIDVITTPQGRTIFPAAGA